MWRESETVFDDGDESTFRYEGNREIRVVYLIDSDGSESLVPKDGRGELVVVHATAKEFRLRKGDNVLCILNEAFDAVGINPGTNTTSPSIERRAKEAPPPPQSREAARHD